MKIKSLLAIIVPLAVLFSSCLKSHNSEDVIDDSGSVISKIQDVGENGGPLKFLSLDLIPSTETVDLITLQVFAPRDNKPNGNVHITLVQDPNAVTAAGYTNLPSNAYSNLVLQYDVPAGGSVKVPITLIKTNLNLANTYGIGFKITTVSQGVISENDKAIVVGIGLKNRWDGVYMMSGTFVDYSNAAFTYYGNQQYELISTGPTSVKVFNDDLGTYGYLFLNNGAPTYYGSFGLNLNFDANTNAITSVTNYYGQPSANGRSANLDPSGTNNWNPATKAIKIKFWLDQPSVITPHRSAFNETWTYLGPR
jgi:hypothetical protein